MAQKEQKKEVKRYYEPKCSPISDVFEWKVDEQGRHYQQKVGEKNFDDEIQLWKDSTDIKILVDKINKQPELIDVLRQQAEAMPYGDVNNYPNEYHPGAGLDALKQIYENQPDSVKQKFPTYEIFANYFTNLSAKLVEDMFVVKEEAKEEKVNEQ